MKIVADRQIPGLLEGIGIRFPEADVVALDGKDISAADVADADALIVRTRTCCDASLLGGSRVKLVATATIGTDHIDSGWCRSARIRVVNAPGCNAPAVMQYVASSLAAAGFDPTRHTLGVVGKGHIGSLVTDLYRRAGGEVLVCDPPRAHAGLTDEDYLPLQDLLRRCDAVTLHVPYTRIGPYPTHHLLAGDLPDTVQWVVNASRGGVVEPAIINTSRRFVVDTWAFEDRPEEWSPEEVREMVNKAFIATPHIAGYSVEGKRRATDAMLTALMEFQGKDTGDIDSDTGNLCYSLPEVIASFDPLPLSEALKGAPEDFERLRSGHLRPEPRPL